jgi:hypothetical protein
MGASILVHWPGATEEEEGGHPGFYNDDKAWASWMAAVSSNAGALRLLEKLGVACLIYCTTDGVDEDEIEWTTPDDLQQAANKLRRLVQDEDERVAPLISIYEGSYDGVENGAEEFAQDLADVASIADYARDQGAEEMVLGYYW